MEVTKYVITNNFSVLYNTREEAEAAFEAEVAKLETAFARGAFKRLYTVAFHSKITIKTSQCRSIAYNHGQDNLVRWSYIKDFK